MPLCNAFQYLQSLTNGQLHEVLALQRWSIPQEYQRNGQHYPWHKLLAQVISGTSLGQVVAEMAMRNQPSVNLEWIIQHQQALMFLQDRNNSYANGNVTQVPAALAVIEDDIPAAVGGGLNAARLGAPRLYVISTHENAFPHITGDGTLVASFLAVHHIVKQAHRKYYLFNDESLCSTVNNGVRGIISNARAEGESGDGIILFSAGLHHTCLELF